MERYHVYWVRNEEHTDILSEGYVGITKNPERRLENHKERGSVRTIILVGSKQYCREIEYKLRPKANIGLNKNPGGMLPMITERGREVIRKRMIANNPMKILRTNSGSFKKGAPSPNTKEQNEKIRLGKLGNKNPNYGKIGCWDHINKNLKECIICGLKTTPGNISRWHNENCRKK